MKKALLTLMLMLPMALLAQVLGSISGKMIDGENGEPLGFVTVAVTPEGATAPTAGCTSDDNGTFRIGDLKEANRDTIICA